MSINKDDNRQLCKIALLAPVFNDWESVAILLERIDRMLESRGWVGDIFLVNDGSTVQIDDSIRAKEFGSIRYIEIIHLRRNLGHQRSIAVGLNYLNDKVAEYECIVVLDADGEDRPEDVPSLVDALRRSPGAAVVFAARSKRLENWRFQVMYHLYRLVHYILTGVSVRVGNFSVLRPSALSKLVYVSELWNHYAAAVFRSRISFQTIPIARSMRYRGRSQMNFASLILHGLSAISVFSDVVGVRLLVLTTIVTILTLLLISIVLTIKFFSSFAIPGWATSAVGLLVIILFQSMLLSMISSFIILGMRSHSNVIPSKDVSGFIESIENIWRKPS